MVTFGLFELVVLIAHFSIANQDLRDYLALIGTAGLMSGLFGFMVLLLAAKIFFFTLIAQILVEIFI